MIPDWRELTEEQRTAEIFRRWDGAFRKMAGLPETDPDVAAMVQRAREAHIYRSTSASSDTRSNSEDS